MFYLMWTIYILWVSSFIALTIIYIKNIVQKYFVNNFVKNIPIISIAIFIISIVSFSYMFIFNRGSNVAQLSESFDLWSFWFQIYGFLFLSNIINIILLILSLIFHKKIFNKNNKLYYIFFLIQIIMTLFHVLSSAPDA